jgi:hypothetical protein
MTLANDAARQDAFQSTLAGRLNVGSHERRHRAEPAPFQRRGEIVLGPATQIEVYGDEVRFLIPFVERHPDEYWLRAFHEAGLSWPAQLCEPRLEEGYGIRLGPLPIGELDLYVGALKERVLQTNRRYAKELEPELRRQRDEARRREEEEQRLRADVEARLGRLLG